MKTQTKQTTLAIGGAALILALAMGVASIGGEPDNTLSVQPAVTNGWHERMNTILGIKPGEPMTAVQFAAVLEIYKIEIAEMQAKQDKSHALFRECADSVFSTAACRKAAGVGQ